MLREELAKSSQCPLENLKVICAGKILKDESMDKNLRDIGLKANSRILISKVDVDQAKAIMMSSMPRIDFLISSMYFSRA